MSHSVMKFADMVLSLVQEEPSDKEKECKY